MYKPVQTSAMTVIINFKYPRLLCDPEYIFPKIVEL